MELAIPLDGPPSGDMSPMASHFQSGLMCPLRTTRQQPASKSVLRALSNRDSLLMRRLALSQPIREDFPPARTAPIQLMPAGNMFV